MNTKTFLFAITAGTACTLMTLASSRMGGAGVPLLFAASLPIYIAALSWGTFAGMAASIIAIVVTAVFAEPRIAIMAGLLFTVPASIIGHQANLAQPTGNGSGMAWYPVSGLLFNLTILVAVGTVVSGFIAGYKPDDLLPPMIEFTQEMLRINPPATPLSDPEIVERARLTIAVLPFVFSGMWLAIHCANLQLASLISRAFGNLARPKDDIPQSTGLPKISLVLLLVSLALAMFLGGALQLAATTVAGALIMAFAMVGLAGLHLRARGSAAGLALLVLSYLMILLIYFPLIIFAIVGITRTSQNKSTNIPPGPPRRPGKT